MDSEIAPSPPGIAGRMIWSIVLLGAVEGGRAHLVFGSSEDIAADMGALLKAAAPLVDGRGGGSSRIAQGGGPRTEGLGAALEKARAVYQLIP